MTNLYRAALVGLGNIGWKFGADASGSSLSHAAAIRKNSHTKLVAGCSPDSDDRNAFEQEYGLPTYVDFKEMLDEVGPQLVSVCSPTANHFFQTCVCMERGIPMVWLEKPAAENSAELRKLLELQRHVNGDSQISVNYHRRYVDSYFQMQIALKEERMGAVRFAEIRYSRGLLTNGSHMLDMIFFMFGETGYELLWVERGSDSNNPSFTLRLENGCLVTVNGCALPYHNIDFSVTCDGGRISILHNDMTPKVEVSVEHEHYPGYYRLKDEGKSFLGRGGSAFSFDRALTDLIESYEAGRLPASSLVTSLPGQELVEKVLYEAAL